jgi:hypothetical protein
MHLAPKKQDINKCYNNILSTFSGCPIVILCSKACPVIYFHIIIKHDPHLYRFQLLSDIIFENHLKQIKKLPKGFSFREV